MKGIILAGGSGTRLSAKGYSLDGVDLNLSYKDQKWLGLNDTFKF